MIPPDILCMTPKVHHLVENFLLQDKGISIASRRAMKNSIKCFATMIDAVAIVLCTR